MKLGFGMATLGRFFERGKRRGIAAQLKLSAAMQTAFSSQDGQIVLAHLAARSGFYKVTLAKDATDRELWQQEGKRLLFAEIFDALSLSDADRIELEKAARREAAIDNDPLEGTNDGS